MNTHEASRIQSLVINISSFSAQFAISMVNLALVYHMRIQFNLSAQMVGISAAIYTSTYFICCILLEPIASRLRPRHSVELSMLGMALSIGLVISTHNVAIAFIALGFYGIAMSFLWPQIEGWLARGKEGRVLNRATSSFNVSWSLGAALSPFATGILVEISTITTLIFGIVGFFIVTGIIAISTKIIPAIRAVESEHVNLRQSTQVDSSTPLRFLSWAGVLTVYAALAVTLTIFPMHAMDNLPFSESLVGILLFIRGVSTVGMFVLMGKTSIWHFKRYLIIITQLLVAAVCIFGTRAHTYFALIIFFLIFGVLFAAAYSFSIFHGASGSINRSKRMIIHEILLTIGTVLGSVVGGGLYQYVDFTVVLYSCALLVSIPAVVSMFYILLQNVTHRVSSTHK
jgi:DHA1 family multidrug resistance protein-like MFS transporter/DHA1 family quinolone resistance protein-like MFS transporter